jgi:hypothetical protein
VAAEAAGEETRPKKIKPSTNAMKEASFLPAPF